MNTQSPTNTRSSKNPLTRLGRALLQWFDTSLSESAPANQASPDGIDWMRTLPFILMHVACIFVFAVGVSPIALVACAALYFIRMFAITGFYHRYFSHRSFKTSRAAQRAWVVTTSLLLCWPCSGVPCGGPLTTGITTSIRTSRKMRIRPSSMASCAPT